MTTEEKRIDEEKSSQLDRPEPIPGFPEFGHIPFEGLRNTRDLGGMPTADGRTIAPAKLLRSGALHKASEQDLARLVGDYDLAGVIDFRTQLERDKEPDPRELMEGVVFYDFPALSGETIGITHGAGVAQDLKTFASYNAGPHELVCGMYPQILLDEAGRVAYTSFLEVLLEGDGGAYLWHCTEGKDRAGLGAVIVERRSACPRPTCAPIIWPRTCSSATAPRGSSTPSARSCGLRAGSMRTSTRCSTPTTTTTTAPWRR